jgi:H+/gluconate symporter-like permease
MLFGLPPIFGLLPLVVYIVLTLRGYQPLVATVAGVLVGAVLSLTPPLEVARAVQAGLGSFLALVGLIIMFGAGLGEVLRATGVAGNIVRFTMVNLGLNTKPKAMLGAMFTSALMVALLGTLAGANSMIAPVMIPIVAAVGLTPTTLSILFHTAGATGLFLGPFTPPVVTLMGFTGLSYPEVLLYGGLPVSVVMWIVAFIMGNWAQRRTEGRYAYTAEDLGAAPAGSDPAAVQSAVQAAPSPAGAERPLRAVAEGGEPASIEAGPRRGGPSEPAGEADALPSPAESRLATIAFALTMLVTIAYGVAIQGGATWALAVMLVSAVVTGLAGGLTLNRLVDAFTAGAGRLVWLFLLFVFLDPFTAFMTKMNAFQAMADALQPLLEAGGRPGFILVSSFIGIFGVPGAAVAQVKIVHEMFTPIVEGLGVPMSTWVFVLLLSSQLDFFAIPAGDMVGQLGIARSRDLKSMIINGWVVSLAIFGLLVVRSFTG